MIFDSWQWQFDQQKALVLNLGHDLIEINCSRRYLQQTLPEQARFDLSDIEHFNQRLDYLEYLAVFDEKQRFLIAVHSAAVLRFFKPQLPQSWYFRFNDAVVWPDTHQICMLDSGLEQGNFLILNSDQRSSLCLFLDDRMMLSPTKKLKQFDTIQVLNDRLNESQLDPFQDSHDLAWLSPA